MIKILVYTMLTLYGGAGGFTAGIIKINSPSINDQLVKHHASEINTLYISGGSGYAFLGNIMLGGCGYGGSIKRTGDSINIKYGTGGGFFEIGYIPFTFKLISPLLSIGIGGYSEELLLSSNVRRSDWESIWNNPRNETKLEHGGFSISPSIGIIIFPENFPLGLFLKVTYNSILSGTWEFEDGTLLSTYPAPSRGHFSLLITLLTGGIKNGKK